MSGGASSAWTQAPAQWKATVSRPEADAAAGDPEVIRLIPSTIVTLESEDGYRDGSSLQDVRRQLRAASRALGRAPRSTPASYALAPAGWLRTSWPKGVEHPAMSRRRNDSDVTGSLVALGDWVSSTIGEDLATLPAARVVFGVDFELAEKGLEVQTLLVFDTSARRVVHATTKFATNAWLLISQRWTDRVWEGVGLLNCHDLATVGQMRREPVTGGRVHQRRAAVLRVFRKEKPELYLHVAHTFGHSSTWRRNWTGFESRLRRGSFAYATAARFEPDREQDLGAFDITRGVVDVRVLLERR